MRRLVNSALLVVLVLHGQAAGSVFSVEEFLQLEPKWQTFAESGVFLKVEGRYSSMSGRLIRFRNCDVPFRPAAGQEFRRGPRPHTSIEVGGRLTRDGAKYVFLVQDVRHVRPDMEEFHRRRARLADDQPSEWYALAEWAARRARFYEDDDLREQAQETWRRGLMTEKRRLKPDDADGLLALAAKTAEFDLPDELRQELVYEAWRLKRQSARSGSAQALDQLAEEMAAALPGADKPPETFDPELAKRSNESPLETYRKASPADRRRLHRVLYIGLVQEIIEAGAHPDGSNGDAVAAEIERRLPERTDLAEDYRDRHLAHRLSLVAGFTRGEMQELAEQFRQRGRPDQARGAVRQWLAAREERLRRDGPGGLMRAAQDYVALLGDEAAAAGLLIEAHRIGPDVPEIAQRLEALGYRQENGRWISRRDAETLPPDPIARAMREGRVAVGMTPKQVRQTLGEPATVTRIASAGQIDEVWLYGPPGASRLAVHVVRRTRGDRSAAVTAVSQISPR